jgi:hypothetical protein
VVALYNNIIPLQIYNYFCKKSNFFYKNFANNTSPKKTPPANTDLDFDGNPDKSSNPENLDSDKGLLGGYDVTLSDS